MVERLTRVSFDRQAGRVAVVVAPAREVGRFAVTSLQGRGRIAA